MVPEPEDDDAEDDDDDDDDGADAAAAAAAGLRTSSQPWAADPRLPPSLARHMTWANNVTRFGGICSAEGVQGVNHGRRVCGTREDDAQETTKRGHTGKPRGVQGKKERGQDKSD